MKRKQKKTVLLLLLFAFLSGFALLDVSSRTPNIEKDTPLSGNSDADLLLINEPRLRSAPGDVSYLHKASPPLNLYEISLDAESSVKGSGGGFDYISQYLELLSVPDSECRKVARVGGVLVCRKGHRRHDDVPIIDGDKLICVDHEMQIPPNGTHRSPTGCLVLSFGIQFDTSFDLSMRRANCEVHMFDYLRYFQYDLLHDPFVHFHQVGLGKDNKYLYVRGRDVTLEVNNLNNLVVKLNLQKRLINVLKVDIEGGEWDVLSDLASEPFLDIIGQIAVELHTMRNSGFSWEDKQLEFKNYTQVIKRLKDRGFRLLSYRNNVLSTKIRDSRGREFYVAGEMLLVNQNWYKPAFRNKYTEFGYNFLHI